MQKGQELPHHIFVKVKGKELAVRWHFPAQPQNSADLPTLVFLHDALGSIAQWKDFPASLVRATGLKGLVFDRWGYGLSEPIALPRPTNYLDREATHFLPAVLSACQIDRPILVGHSDGGTIALLYAAAFPHKTIACITEAAHVFVEDVTLSGIRATVQAWKSTDLRDRLARYHGEKTETVFRGWSETWLRGDFRNWSMLHRLAQITCPLLVVQGMEDEYGTAAQVEAIVQGVSGEASPLFITDCGHNPHAQAADVTLRAMARFIDSVRQSMHKAPPGKS